MDSRTGLFDDIETEEERRRRLEKEAAAQAVPTEVTSESNPPPKSRTGLFDDIPAPDEAPAETPAVSPVPAGAKSRTGLFDDIPEPPKGELDNTPMGVVGRHLQAAAQGAAGPLAGMAVGAELALEPIQAWLGIKGEKEDKNKFGFQAAKGIRDLAATFGAPDERDQSISLQVARGLGQLGTQVGLAVIPGVGIGLSAGSALGSGAEEMYNDAIAHGASHDTALKAAGIGAVISAPELILTNRIAGKLAGNAGKEAKGKIVGEILKSFLIEGSTEGAQTMGQNVGAYGLGYDKTRTLLTGVPEATLVGGITGGIAGGVTHAVTRHVEDVEPKAPSAEEKEALSTTGTPSPEAAARPAATPEELVASGAVGADEALAAVAGVKGDIAKKVSGARELLKKKRGAGIVEPAVAPTAPVTPAAAPLQTAAGVVPGASPPVVPSGATVPPQTVLPTAPGTAPPTAPPVGPGAATAMPEGLPMPPAGTPLPVAEQPVTPEVTSPEAVAAGQTIPTVPETEQSIEAQRQALQEGKRSAVFYPYGSPLPEKVEGGTIYRMEVAGGMLDFTIRPVTGPDGTKRPGLSKKGIRLLDQMGQMNLILDLGPVNKAEVVESIAAGNEPLMVVERTPEGVEMKAAAGTEETAEAQIAAMEETKADAGNTVTVEDPNTVLAARQAGEDVPPAPEVTSEVTPETPQISDINDTPPAKAPKKPVQRGSAFKLGVQRPTPSRPVATPPGAKEGPSKPEVSPPAPEPAKEAAPKGKKAKEISISRADPKAPRKKPKKPPGPTIHYTEHSEEDRAKAQELRERNKQELVEAVRREEAPAKAEAKEEKKEQVREKAKKREYSSIVDEAYERLRKAGSANLTDDEIFAMVQRSKIFEQVFNRLSALPELVENRQQANNLAEDVQRTLREAQAELRTIGPPPSGREASEKYVRATLMPEKKVGYDTVTGHVIWMREAQRIVDLIGRAKERNREMGAVTLRSINDFVQDTKALQQGDDTLLRERRKQEGEQAMARSGAKEIEQIAATQEQDVVPEEGAEETVKAGVAPEAAEVQSAPEEVESEADIGARVTSSQSRSGLNTAGLTEEEQAVLEDTGRTAQTDPRLKAMMEEMNAKLRAKVTSEVTEMREKGKKHRISMAGLESLLEDPDADVDAVVDEVLRVAAEKGMDPKTNTAMEILSLQTETAGTMSERVSGIVTTLTAAVDENHDLRKFFGKRVLSRIKSVIPNVKVVVISDEHMDMIKGPRVAGIYNPGTDIITLRASYMVNPVVQSEVFIHEAVHAMAVHSVMADKDLKIKLDKLLQYVRDHSDMHPDTYGLTDADEFVAELFANPAFQQELAKVQIPKAFWFKNGFPPLRDPTLTTALQAFKYFIAKILKLPGRNGLDIGLQYATFALDTGPEARDLYYSPANPPNTNVEDGPDQLLNIDRMKQEAEDDPPKQLRDRLEESGIPSELAAELETLINDEFGGTLSDEELKDIAGEYGKPITSQSNLEDKLAKTPPGGKDVVTDVVEGKGYNKATKTRAWLLKLMTLDFIRQKYRDLFNADGKNILDQLILAQQKYEGYVEEYARVFNENAVALAKLGRGRNGARMLHDMGVLAMDATRFNVRLGPGANNAHLGKDAVLGLQAKQALPELQARFDKLSPQAKKLYAKVVADYRNAHNSTKGKIAANVMMAMDLDTKLTPKAFDEIVDKTINGKLAEADADLVGPDAYRALKNAQSLRKIEGDYFPQMRFGEHVVVTTDKVDTPDIKTMTIKSSKKVVPVQVSVLGQHVRIGTSYSERGGAAQLARVVKDYVASNPLQVLSVTRRYRDTKTGVLVAKGDKRLGNTYDLTYDIVVQNQGVHYFESNREAQKFYKANKDISKGVFPRNDDETPQQVLGGDPSWIESRIQNNTRLTEDQKKMVSRALTEAVISGMPGNRSPAKYMARRNVMGFSTDITRASAMYGGAHGSFMAQLETAPEINEAMSKLRNIAKNAARTNGKTGPAQIQVIKEIMRRTNLTDNAKQPGPIFKTLSTLSFFGTLASPAHSMINATQVWMNTYPVLAGEYGMMPTAIAVNKAYLKMGMPFQLLRGVTHTAKSLLKWSDLAIDTSDLPKSVRKLAGDKYTDLFDYMTAHGSLNEHAGFEVASSTIEAKNVFTGTIARFDRAARQMPGMVEYMNRSVTGMATYDLARRKGMSHEDAIKKAHDVAQSTQFDYRKSNLPPFMKSGVLGFAMQFRSYAINQTLLYADMYGRIVGPNSTVRERYVATKQLMNLMGMQAAVAGAMGLPGVELIKLAAIIFGSLTQDEEEWDTWKVWWSNVLRDIVPGTGWDELLVNGGIAKALGIDISNRMSYADLWTAFGPDGYNAKDWQAYIGGLFMGAPGQQLADAWVKAPAKLAEGKADEALELFVPIKVFSDSVKAWRGVQSGEMTPDSAIKQVIGFKSSEQAAEDTKKYNTPKTKNEKIIADYRQQRYDLVNAYKDAKTAGAQAKVASKIREFNRSRKPKTVFDISIKNEDQKIRDKKAGREPALEWE